ncbi:TPA: hypothetical protein TXJ16_000764 [Streptococcus suis]|nr:hypothetical protein [Streptococcus suis]HEL1586261.1 hypothetical protein [Streptococcus suis]
MEVIDEVLIVGHSLNQVALDYALTNQGTLPKWIAQYKKNGYTFLEKRGGH